MADIYGNSFLTISASESSRAEAGMFITPSEDGRNPCFQVSAALGNGDTITMNVRKMERHEDLVRQQPTEESRLVKRAWTFQEHLLAPRVLQLGTYEAVWECSGTTSCSFSIELPDSAGINLKRPFTHQLRNPSPVMDDKSWVLWSAIVQGYSNRSLTQGTDKLVALSGVAKRLQQSWGCQYLAGLWKTGLIKWLCWSITETVTPPPPRPRPYCAPTWSWSSVDGGIKFSNKLTQHDELRTSVEALVLNTQYHTVSSDLTGAISSARLIISAPLVNAEYTRRSESGSYMLRRGGMETGFSPTLIWDSLEALN